MYAHANDTGTPLAESGWLATHHRAKLSERRAFARRIAELRPQRVVDIGCGPGLWLEVLNEELPIECEFVGYDTNVKALKEARLRASSWRRPTRFEPLDVGRNPSGVVDSDVTLLFNVLCYLDQPHQLLDALHSRPGGPGLIAVRQYDGDALRFGPMLTRDRAYLDAALRERLETRTDLRHYDLDRTFAALFDSKYRLLDMWHELYSKFAPFSDGEWPYIQAMVAWMLTTSQVEPTACERWLEAAQGPCGMGYFYEVDLVAILAQGDSDIAHKRSN